MKILLVDDMVSIRHIMIHMLRDLGYHDVDEAIDGQQALKLINTNSYDIVITDLNMPNIDGQELLLRIRKSPATSETPVLMISCECDKGKIKALIKAKLTGFIVKPFNSNTLKSQMDRISEKLQQDMHIELS